MAYHDEDGTYSCDLCGFRNGWDASDDHMENCGDVKNAEKYFAQNALRISMDTSSIWI